MPRREDTPRLRGVINTIARGFVGGSLISAKRRYLHTINNIHANTNRVPRQLPPITFIDQDFVLIDQGNSAGIMYMSTFKRLQIPEAKICPYHEQLVGFLSKRVDIHGYIDLLTTFSQDLIQRLDQTLNIEYSWRHSIHPTPSYEIPLHTIKVNQKMARQDYVDSSRVVTRPPRENNISAHV
ncbi:hypothetical protein CR513_60132, partial [Mucuna pruriens]